MGVKLYRYETAGSMHFLLRCSNAQDKLQILARIFNCSKLMKVFEDFKRGKILRRGLAQQKKTSELV